MVNAKEFIAWFLITVIPFILMMGFILFIIVNSMQPELFKESCENFGYYYELQNTSCQVNHENCIYTCRINNKIYDLDSVGFGTGLTFNKYFCVEDCKFKNKDGLVCMC